MTNTGPLFFGYGSLVNCATHEYPETRPAIVQGWRRVWRHLDHRPYAILGAVADPSCDIPGLVASVPGGDWSALDLREQGYDRVHAAARVVNDPGPATPVAIYSIPADKHRPATAARPILLSYLDVVLQGYLTVFGPDTARTFFDTTHDWSMIHDDRAAPIYPRAQMLSTQERAFVDGELAARGITR